MQVYSTLASIFTVISFFVFVGIVCWAWSAQRKTRFDAAALEPFVLPDESADWQRAARNQPAARAAASATAEGARS